MRFIRPLMLLVAILLIATSVLVDLLPQSKAGFGTKQIMLASAGVFLLCWTAIFRRDSWQKQLLVGTMIVLTLSVVEIGLHIFAPATLRVRQELEQYTPGLKKQIVYERNEFGFRSLSMRTEEKPPNTLRIIALGASTTDQCTQNTEDMWSAILEKMLQDEFAGSGLNIEVAAIGEAGTTVMQRVRWARQNIERFQPDLVITLEGINDLWLLGGPEYSYDGLPEDNWATATLKQIKAACLRHSQLCLRTKFAIEALDTRQKLKNGEAIHWRTVQQDSTKLPYVENPVREPDPFIEFSEGFAELVSLLTASDIDVVILEQPMLWKLDLSEEERARMWFVESPAGKVRPGAAWMVNEMRRYNSYQAEISERFGTGFLKLDGEIPKNLEYFFDDCHYTDLGSRRMAELIFPVIRDRIRQHHLP